MKLQGINHLTVVLIQYYPYVLAICRLKLSHFDHFNYSNPSKIGQTCLSTLCYH